MKTVDHLRGSLETTSKVSLKMPDFIKKHMVTDRQ